MWRTYLIQNDKDIYHSHFALLLNWSSFLYLIINGWCKWLKNIHAFFAFFHLNDETMIRYIHKDANVMIKYLRHLIFKIRCFHDQVKNRSSDRTRPKWNYAFYLFELLRKLNLDGRIKWKSFFKSMKRSDIHQIRILFELIQLNHLTVREYIVSLDISDAIYLLFSCQKKTFSNVINNVR